LDKCLLVEPRLGDATIRRLYSNYIAGVDSALIERISGDFRRVMVGIAESAATTGDSAARFGHQLQGLSDALQAEHMGDLTPQMQEVLQGTSKMQSSAQALRAQVQAGQAEIDRLQEELERVRDEALLCPLARIFNRKGFDQKLADMLQNPPSPGMANCLVMVDIDHFKKVNDQHGHVTGDRVIQGLGEVLKQTVIGESYLSARYGGEEFAMVLPNTTLASAIELAEKLRNRVKRMKIRNRKTQEEMLSVTVSLGLAAMRQGDDALSLIARADEALYKSKQSGRDQLTCAVAA
jgi:diguanylate cyclase